MAKPTKPSHEQEIRICVDVVLGRLKAGPTTAEDWDAIADSLALATEVARQARNKARANIRRG